jgi:hypothetical protein
VVTFFEFHCQCAGTLVHVNHMSQHAHMCVYLCFECLRGTWLCMYAICMQDVAYEGLCVQVDHDSLFDFRNLKKIWNPDTLFP